MSGACANTSAVPKAIPTGQPHEQLPASTAMRAAQIVRLSPSTVRLWARGDGEHAALFTPAQHSPLTLSFSNLVESFVLASMRRVHGISMQRVRKALKFVGRELGVQRPLIRAQFRTAGVPLFVDHADRLLDVTSPEQALLREVLDASLDPIGSGHHLPDRLYPCDPPDPVAPKSIAIDPRRASSHPTIAA